MAPEPFEETLDYGWNPGAAMRSAVSTINVPSRKRISEHCSIRLPTWKKFRAPIEGKT